MCNFIARLSKVPPAADGPCKKTCWQSTGSLTVWLKNEMLDVRLVVQLVCPDGVFISTGTAALILSDLTKITGRTQAGK